MRSPQSAWCNLGRRGRPCVHTAPRTVFARSDASRTPKQSGASPSPRHAFDKAHLEPPHPRIATSASSQRQTAAVPRAVRAGSEGHARGLFSPLPLGEGGEGRRLASTARLMRASLRRTAGRCRELREATWSRAGRTIATAPSPLTPQQTPTAARPSGTAAAPAWRLEPARRRGGRCCCPPR